MLTLIRAEKCREVSWWQTSGNPACRPWCTDEHQPDELAATGGLLCSQVVDDGGWFAVNVVQATLPAAGDTAGVFKVGPRALSVWCDGVVSDQSPAEVRRYASALLDATSMVEDRIEAVL